MQILFSPVTTKGEILAQMANTGQMLRLLTANCDVSGPGREVCGAFELHDSDPLVANGTRTEVDVRSALVGIIGGTDDWYGFSFYLPTGYAIDDWPYTYLGLGAFELLAQWHVAPDAGEVWRNPVLFLVTDGGKWKFVTRHSGTPIQQAAQRGQRWFTWQRLPNRRLD